jgi:hypothetical protein
MIVLAMASTETTVPLIIIAIAAFGFALGAAFGAAAVAALS